MPKLPGFPLYDARALRAAAREAALAAFSGLSLPDATTAGIEAVTHLATEALPREAAEDLYFEAQRHYREQIYDFEAAFTEILARFAE